MRRDVDEEVRLLAAEQHAAFARWQAIAAGADDHIIGQRCAAGTWTKEAVGVYVLADAPPDPARRLWVAWLAVGPTAVVSHETAGECHGLEGVVRGLLVFTTAHGDHRRLPGITVHQLADVLPHHVEWLDDLPTTTIPRTIVDLAAVSRVERLAHIVDEAVSARRTTDEEIARTLAEVARRGKWGVGKLAAVLGRRKPGDPVPDSVLEQMLLRALLDAGLPPPERQFTHPGRNPARGCVDFAYPDVKLILEADGRRWHQRIADLKRDRARDNEAARAGWQTMRFMWEELESDPADVGRAVIEARAHRRAEN